MRRLFIVGSENGVSFRARIIESLVSLGFAATVSFVYEIRLGMQAINFDGVTPQCTMPRKKYSKAFIRGPWGQTMH